MTKKLPLYSAFALFFLALALVLSSGCDNRAEQAAAYNDRVVSLQTDLVTRLNALDSALNNLDTEQAERLRLELLERLNVHFTALDSFGSFEEDTELIEASKNLFTAYSKVVSTDYARFIALMSLPDTQFTTDAQEEAFKLEKRLISQVDSAHEAFRLRQEAFGARYRLVFETP